MVTVEKALLDPDTILEIRGMYYFGNDVFFDSTNLGNRVLILIK